jgi:hypothetical protein
MTDPAQSNTITDTRIARPPPKDGDPCAVCDVPWSLDPTDVHSPLHYGKDAHRFVKGKTNEHSNTRSQ